MSTWVRRVLVVVAALAAVAAIAFWILGRAPRLSQQQVVDMYATGVTIGELTYTDPLEEQTEAPAPNDCGDQMWHHFIAEQSLISAATEDGLMANTVVLDDAAQARERLSSVRRAIDNCDGPGTTYRLSAHESRHGTRWAVHDVFFDGQPNGQSMLWQYHNVVVTLTLDPRISAEQADSAFRQAVDQVIG